jgi:hypothetical protein
MWKGILAKIRPEAKSEPLRPLKIITSHVSTAIPATVKGTISAPPMWISIR